MMGKSYLARNKLYCYYIYARRMGMHVLGAHCVCSTQQTQPMRRQKLKTMHSAHINKRMQHRQFKRVKMSNRW